MTGVLVDTSVWVNHFRQRNDRLSRLLVDDQVLCHPLIVLELACGTPPAPRTRTLAELSMLRQTSIATHQEVLALIERHQLQGSGCGAVDVSLLAATLLTPDIQLWSNDTSLQRLAQRLGVAFGPLS